MGGAQERDRNRAAIMQYVENPINNLTQINTTPLSPGLFRRYQAF
jgi:hypothetical protein